MLLGPDGPAELEEHRPVRCREKGARHAQARRRRAQEFAWFVQAGKVELPEPPTVSLQ